MKKNSLTIIIIETAHLSEVKKKTKKTKAMFTTIRFNYSTDLQKLENFCSMSMSREAIIYPTVDNKKFIVGIM